MFDKQIHRDQFRLRILVTNGCNRNCSFCLNDFQKKPAEEGELLFISNPFLSKVVETYLALSDRLGFEKHISISGGEPGIHPKIYQILRKCSGEQRNAMVNTNGTLLDHPKWDKICLLPLDVRVSVGDKPDEKVVKKLKETYKCSVQHVLTEGFSFVDKVFLADFYAQRGIKVKFFIDFKGNQALMERYKEFITVINATKLKETVSYRYTGVQENRGFGCFDCAKRCITLKAAWVLPNGVITPCPQDHGRESLGVRGDLQYAYNFHKILEN